MNTIKQINELIGKLSEEERNKVSDWYHTFGELYEHRCVLFMAFVNTAKQLSYEKHYWRAMPKIDYTFKKSKLHHDWTSFDWWFIVQWYIYWEQISYHLPMKYRDDIDCYEAVIADERDWHTSQDVLDRLLLV